MSVGLRHCPVAGITPAVLRTIAASRKLGCTEENSEQCPELNRSPVTGIYRPPEKSGQKPRESAAVRIG